MNDKLWKNLGVIVTIIAIIAPLYVAYDIFERGNTINHKLEIVELFDSRPTSFLADFKGKFELTADGEKIEHLDITYFSIQNIGKKPILPKEFFENISVSVDESWKIIGVSNQSSYPEGLELTWQKLSDREFFAQPTLINPQDYFFVAVYTVSAVQDLKEEKPGIEWNARIENLTNILTQKQKTYSFNLSSGLVVLLSGWAIPFVISSFILLFGAVLLLSGKSGVLPGVTGKKTIIIVSFATLAISVSEVLAFYIFEPVVGGGSLITTWLNLSLLAFQSVLFILLSIKIINKVSVV